VDQLDTESKLSTFLNKPTLLHILPENERTEIIMGMTTLGSELFILRLFGRYLDVYNTISFTWTHKLEIPGSEYLELVVACQRNNCLYISDAEQKIIYRIQFDRSENVLSYWSVGGLCRGLSVTRSYSVLVTLPMVNRVEEYSTDGSLMRYIRIDHSIAYPRHCIQLSSDQFVVCHGDLWGTGKRLVCIIDTSGQIVYSYGGPDIGQMIRLFDNVLWCDESNKSHIGHRMRSSHVTVDKHDHVMVADWANDKVELLSPTLTNLGYIQILGHELHNPCTLHLDELNHRLYIGEKGGRIYVLAGSAADS